MWIRKKENKMNETEEFKYTILSDAPANWQHPYGGHVLREGAIIQCTEQYALAALKRCSAEHKGYNFTLARLVARAKAPLQQEFELL
jgi:hypothetical protein